MEFLVASARHLDLHIQILESRAQNLDPIIPTEDRVGRALRVRHHADHIAAFIADTGNRTSGAIEIGVGSHFAVWLAIAKDDLAALFHAIEGLVVGIERTVSVCDRQVQHCLVSESPWVQAVAICLNDEVDPSAVKLQRLIAEEGAGKQVCFGQDLETIAQSRGPDRPIRRIS